MRPRLCQKSKSLFAFNRSSRNFAPCSTPFGRASRAAPYCSGVSAAAAPAADGAERQVLITADRLRQWHAHPLEVKRVILHNKACLLRPGCIKISPDPAARSIVAGRNNLRFLSRRNEIQTADEPDRVTISQGLVHPLQHWSHRRWRHHLRLQKIDAVRAEIFDRRDRLVLRRAVIIAAKADAIVPAVDQNQVVRRGLGFQLRRHNVHVGLSKMQCSPGRINTDG